MKFDRIQKLANDMGLGLIRNKNTPRYSLTYQDSHLNGFSTLKEVEKYLNSFDSCEAVRYLNGLGKTVFVTGIDQERYELLKVTPMFTVINWTRNNIYTKDTVFMTTQEIVRTSTVVNWINRGTLTPAKPTRKQS